jgi:asparagine synthase (glutamine-hydrolysing)
MRINERQIQRYLVNGYKSLNKGRETWFSGVETFPASCHASLQGPDMPNPERYWSLSYSPQQMTAEEAAEGVREKLERALRLRLRSDVPLAFCLSGGIDSSALASLAVRELDYDVHAFSIIDSDERYDETRNIRATVSDLGCSLHEIHCTTEGFLDRMEAQIAYHDAPIATISYYMHAFISEALSAEGFKVAISGTAADELFTGYYDHYGIWLAEMSERPDFDDLVADWRRTYGSHVRNPVLKDPLAFKVNTQERSHIYLDREKFNALLIEPVDEDFHEAGYGSNLLRLRMLNELFHEVIPVILNEDDLNSMQYSVENRSPYLDRELAEFAYTIPNHNLIHDGLPKWPLRNALDGCLNDQVRLDGQKRGFNASIESLLDRNDPEVKQCLLDPSPIFDLVRREAVEDFLNADLTDNSFSKFVFSFVSAKIFLESDLATGHMDRAAA